MIKKIIVTTAAIAILATSGVFVAAPRPASADVNSTIGIAAAAALIGVLLFDSNNRPYYYRGGYRYYVPEPVATYYFQRNYSGWYAQHGRDWNYNRGQFAHDWNRYHGNGYQGNGGGNGYQGHGGGYQGGNGYGH